MLFDGYATPLPWHECGTYHSVGAVMTAADYTKLMLALIGREAVFRDGIAQTMLRSRTTTRGLQVGFGLHMDGDPDAIDFCVRSVGHYAFGWWAVSLAYPNATEPFCVTVCTNLADQCDVFNPPEQYAFGILAYEIASWIRSGEVDARSLANRAEWESYVMGLVAADRFAGLMGADLGGDEIARIASGTRAIVRAPAFDFDKERFIDGYLDMQAAVRDGRIEDFLATECPVGGVFRKLARKGWGARNFDDPVPVKFWLDRLER
jgi:hypothetical protein